MESQNHFISKVKKEKLFYLYKEISRRIENDLYEKSLRDTNNEQNNIESENNKNMLKIISQLKQNINDYKTSISLYKESAEEIEIKNKNYYQINQAHNFLLLKVIHLKIYYFY